MSLTKFNTAVSRFFLSNAFAATKQRSGFLSTRDIHRHRRMDDSIFGVASNLMRGLDYEFNNLKNSLFKDENLPQSSIPAQYLLPLSDRLPKSEDLIMVDKNGNRKFQLEIDLKGFSPEEINIETKGNILTVSAKKEKESKDSYVLREFSESYSLPADLKVDSLKSKMLNDSILFVDGDLPKQIESEKQKQLEEKTIPIKHQKK